MSHGAAWLSQGIESLRERLGVSAAQPRDCDLLVIGSGYGGAVAAARLAGRGAEVIVIERGREWLPGMFPSRFGELPGAVRFSLQDGKPPRGRADGLFDVRIGPDVNLLVGSGLGGGSLINAAVMERPDPSVWSSGWPTGLNAELLEDAYRDAEAMLGVSQYKRPPEGPAKLEALDRLAANVRGDTSARAREAKVAISFSTDASPAGVDREPCRQCGDCVTGCNWKAKNSLDANYLALARRRGAALYTGVLALKLRRASAGWEVECVPTVPPAGTTAAQARLTIRARRVIVAAGVLGSTELLMRSQSDTLRFSKRLGERFSANGDAIFAAVGHLSKTNINAPETMPPEQRKTGPTITGIVEAAHGASRFVVEEFAIPAPLRRVLAEVTGSFGLLHRMVRGDSSPHVAGQEREDPLAVGDEALAKTMIYGVLGDDGAGGRLCMKDSEGGLHDGAIAVDGSKLRSHPQFGDQDDGLRAWHEGSDEVRPLIEPGGALVPNPAWRPLPKALQKLLELPDGPLVTVHPLGGCAMADDAEHGVVDLCGRVFDPGIDGVHDGLAVLDGSIVPRALGINPSLTIAALAEHAVRRLAARWGLGEESTLPAGSYPQPRWSTPVAPDAMATTAAAFGERLHGPLTLGGQRYWAELDISFEPAPDLDRFIARQPRALSIRAGELRLYPDRDREDELLWRLLLSGSLFVMETEDSIAEDRIGLAFKFSEGGSAASKLPIGVKIALGTRLGERRRFVYRFRVDKEDAGAPMSVGDRLLGEKIVEGRPGETLWRQLSTANFYTSDATGHRGEPLGTLEVDLADFARRKMPLLALEQQLDAPSAIMHAGGLLLYFVRTLFKLHLLNVADGGDQPLRIDERQPGTLDGLRHEWIPLRRPCCDEGWLGVTRYVRASGADVTLRPVLLLHGLSAGGSTFAHKSIPDNFVLTLCRSGRAVYVAELRTSIVHPKDSLRDWTLEEIATGDIPELVSEVCRLGQTEHIDVVAHCIGAAMFCTAALRDASIGPRIGAAVLSQVAPMLKLSPMNRFRGYVLSYLRQYLNAELLDTRPDEVGLMQRIVDRLLTSFPYPEGDNEREWVKQYQDAYPKHDFRTVRHRADAIWGQLFELKNVGNATLAALDAIFGHVRVATAAETIHFAQAGLLTGADGRNVDVGHERIKNGMNFPLLIVHGRENRVFDWRGSRDAFDLFKRVFKEPAGTATVTDQDLHLGGGTPRQLHVFGGYGHQDCFIGKESAMRLFPVLLGFLDEQRNHLVRAPAHPPPSEAAEPWIGPVLGRLNIVKGEASVAVQLRPSPRRSRTVAVAFARLQQVAGDDWKVDQKTLGFVCDFNQAKGEFTDLGPHLREQPLDLHIRLVDDTGNGYRPGQPIVALTIHDDFIAPVGAGIPEVFDKRPLFPGLLPDVSKGRAFTDAVLAKKSAELLAACLRLSPAVLSGAANGATSNELAFAVASCQYPPGLLDARIAQRSVAALDQRSADLQFQLLLGDQVYVDETAGVFDPAPAHRVVDQAYERVRRMRAMRGLQRKLPTYALFDDHEVRDNWQPVEPIGVDDQYALDACGRWQLRLNPKPLAEKTNSFEFAPGGWPVFAIDSRSRRNHRGPAGMPIGQASLFDKDDLTALLAWLGAQPRDQPKFIACPSVLLPIERFAPPLGLAERLACDSGSGYPRSQLDLLLHIAAKDIRHVVLLSGDAHLSVCASLQIEGGPVVHTIVSSGLYSPWPFANEREESLVLDGPVEISDGSRALRGTMVRRSVQTEAGFAIVRAAAGPPPTLTVELHAAASGTVQRIELPL